MIDDKTRDLIAALLTIPVASKVLEDVQDTKHMEREMEEVASKFFSLRRIVKEGYDRGYGG